MHRWCLLNLTVQGFSLNLTVRGESNKHCLLTFSFSLNISFSCQEPGRVAQSVMCLATDACLTADPGVASSIPARSHTFMEIDHEIISTVVLLPSTE